MNIKIEFEKMVPFPQKVTIEKRSDESLTIQAKDSNGKGVNDAIIMFEKKDAVMLVDLLYKLFEKPPKQRETTVFFC